MSSLNQNTVNAIAAAIVVEGDDPQMQDIEEGLGHLLQYHLNATRINHGSINVNRMAFRVFQDMDVVMDDFTIVKAVLPSAKCITTTLKPLYAER
ncbi:hypothetical protein EAF00_000399 [Botryotinia globosa]|nr:hypothetical protein EAF00_000399 [Botryotinia globosa]